MGVVIFMGGCQMPVDLEKLDVTDVSVEKVQIASNNCG